MIPEASLWIFACVHNSMTLVAQHFVDISMTAALEHLSSSAGSGTRVDSAVCCKPAFFHISVDIILLWEMSPFRESINMPAVCSEHNVLLLL